MPYTHDLNNGNNTRTYVVIRKLISIKKIVDIAIITSINIKYFVGNYRNENFIVLFVLVNFDMNYLMLIILIYTTCILRYSH